MQNMSKFVINHVTNYGMNKLMSRVRIIALNFTNCEVNSYYCNINVSHSMKM